MPVYKIDPLSDLRWSDFIVRHPDSSIFHSPGWLKSLQLTYGYEPFVFTTDKPNNKLTNGLLFCIVNSLFTGKRLVSLPFSDHCELLGERSKDINKIILELEQYLYNEKLKYIELRPLKQNEKILEVSKNLICSHKFYFHKLDIVPEAEKIFSGFHKSSIRYKIRRAERENYNYEKGISEDLLKKFYYLQVKTRRRHSIPPQPVRWFKNLIRCFPNNLDIHVISDKETPIASIITITYKDILFWKYSASDPIIDRFGVTRVLIWKSICQAKEIGLKAFDMGRSEKDNPGLVDFKNRWGANRTEIKYYRYSKFKSNNFADNMEINLVRSVFTKMPNWALELAGKLLYKHIG